MKVVVEKKLFFFDQGCFFEFEKDESYSTSEIISIKGIPGDIKQEWEIKYLSHSGIVNAYKQFFDKFPFGSENLSTIMPLKDEFDIKSDIEYKFGNNKLEIKKNISVGTIHIILTEFDNKTEVEYALEYPNYDSEFDG